MDAGIALSLLLESRIRTWIVLALLFDSDWFRKGYLSCLLKLNVFNPFA
jgi:hypothetical protein